MRTFAWACALLFVLLIAQPAMCETWSTDDISFDVDTDGACVLIPEGHRRESACAGVNAPDRANYVFLALMPFRGAAPYWLGILRMVSSGLAETKRTLEEFLSRDGQWHVDASSTSTTTNAGELRWSSIDFELTSSADPKLEYVERYAVPATTNGYVVETFVERAHRREVAERMATVLDTWRQRSSSNTSGVPAVSSAVQRVWYIAAFAIVIVLVVRDARSRSEKKPPRAGAPGDLRRYETARRLGLVFASLLCASVVIELLAYTTRPHASALLRAIAGLVSVASLAPMLLWVHRVTVNARALGCAGVPTATMAVTWFFVPAASVFMPYRSIADVAGAMRVRGRMDAVWRVALWWIPVVAMYASRAFGWSVACTLFTGISALAAWSMIVAIDQGQARMFRKEKKRRKASAAQLVDAT